MKKKLLSLLLAGVAVLNLIPTTFAEDILTTEDAIIILRNVAGLEGMSKEQRVKYDFNGDGIINTQNALIILRAVVGLEDMSKIQEQIKEREKQEKEKEEAMKTKEFNDRIEAYLSVEFIPFKKALEENEDIISIFGYHQSYTFYDSNGKVIESIRTYDKNIVLIDDIYYINSEMFVEILKRAMKNKQE